ncbi:probable chitinase 10 [Polistes fuscatus]|uniref:probable chitinase 10 n=1 Tax=Polistes fuscatus TaxID=30207 RepID=UPI001CA93D6B|nr:probable chitinase 10 [Polistes fuscatus]
MLFHLFLGSFSWVAICAITLAVVDVEAAKLKELPTKFKDDYQPYVCEEDTIEPHDSKCNIYYKCINKQLVLKECESGLHLDRTRKVCTTPEEAKCPSYNIKVCKEGSYKSNDKECHRYYKCKNNQWDNKQCPTGLLWNRKHTICTSPEETNCRNGNPDTCKEGSYKPNDEECDRYYKCTNNQWNNKECPTGLLWNRDHTICTEPEIADCRNGNSGPCKEGSYKPNDKLCNRYYKCKNNQWYYKKCPTGMHWNREHTICTSPEEADCYNGLCEEGSYKPHDKECNRYYKCKSNQWDHKECPTGMHWDRDHTICTSPEEANCQNGSCEEGSYKPHENECSQYYKCKNNQWDSKECPTGMHWNREHTICTSAEQSKCYNGSCEEGSYKPHENECSQYYKCKNNQWDSRECPTGMHWNREHTICISAEQSKCTN